MKIFGLWTVCVILATLYDESLAGCTRCGDFDMVGSKCLKLVPHHHQTFKDAIETCKEHDSNSTLPIIHSQEEQDLFFNYFRKAGFINSWLGATNEGGEFRFVDGSELNYTNWQAGSPKNLENSCALMRLDEGQWIDERCDTSEGQVVCQKEPSMSTEELYILIMDIKKEFSVKITQFEAKIEHLQVEIDILNLTIHSIINETHDSVPIGFIYIQLAFQRPPTEVWPKLIWDEVSCLYDSSFLRVFGNYSAEFEKFQQESAPRLEGIITGDEYSIPKPRTKAPYDNYIPMPYSGWSQGIPVGGYDGVPIYANFNYSKSEIRPRNTAVRVWQRVG